MSAAEVAMLKLAGIVLLAVLILVGALMPLKYTARMHLPKRPRGTGAGDRQGQGPDPGDGGR